MKIGVLYRAPIHLKNPNTPLRLRYQDDNFPGHAGWKEIVVTTAPGVTLAANPFQADRSAQLTDYPTNLLNSPPQDLEADLTWALTSIDRDLRAISARNSSANPSPAAARRRHSASQDSNPNSRH